MSTKWKPVGKHLIAGEWVKGETSFLSDPVFGAPYSFASGTSADIDKAVQASEDAFWSYGYSKRKQRAELLFTIADEIDLRASIISRISMQETGLSEVRLDGERIRTTNQLRFFADHILKGDYLDRRYDQAIPERKPLPKPDIRLMQRPIGPVGVFGASNFPLAFSTAGGDTASALAAGCPVIVKGHPGHPGTGEIIADAIDVAIKKIGIHSGVFSLIQSDSEEAGEALVKHPLISAIGFTGSLAGGRALFNLANNRPKPIPFYGEMGSINPIFLLPHATKNIGRKIATVWTESLMLGVGQFCTNPSIVIVIKGDSADIFQETAVKALSEIKKQNMLTSGIACTYRINRDRIKKCQGVSTLIVSKGENRRNSSDLFLTSGDVFLNTPVLSEEVFGPLGIIVQAKNEEQLLEIAHHLEGQLTCTLHLDDADQKLAQKLLLVLERKAGRLLVNDFPTGVEVCDSMMHGGPYPASTSTMATSVGSMAIRRFLRPVSYQNMPDSLLPSDLRKLIL